MQNVNDRLSNGFCSMTWLYFFGGHNLDDGFICFVGAIIRFNIEWTNKVAEHFRESLILIYDWLYNIRQFRMKYADLTTAERLSPKNTRSFFRSCFHSNREKCGCSLTPCICVNWKMNDASRRISPVNPLESKLFLT